MIRTGGQKSRLDEIHQINRRFLELIAMRACNNKNDIYGLPADLCRQIAGLSSVQRDIMAVVPLLLVTATGRAISEASAVRDEEMTEPQEYMRIDVAEQNFTTALMTWLTRGDQREHTLASLWQGTPESEGESIRHLSFGEIQMLAPFAGRILRARLVDRPGMWTELILAAQSKDSRRQQLARLGLLPHSYPKPKRPRRGPPPKRRK